MGISSSLYSGISGLSSLSQAMSVIGDNVANVNTVAFKSSRITFEDVLSQTVSTGAGLSQVGRGVSITTVDGLFAQGSFESSSQATDMAIGGIGFFMLRSPSSDDLFYYTRAGEFRFDDEGKLINPAGYFVQGWAIDSDTGSAVGTKADINIGLNTPPVTTDNIQVIANLDARTVIEDEEIRLFDTWDARRMAASVPTSPIDSNNYDYSTAIKMYDSLGTSHVLTVYFDRTSNDNEWEYLITCEPEEDMRYISDSGEQAIYGSERYDYTMHKGAGALQYGVINFSTSGDITDIAAYNVPPDAEVEPALIENRILLTSADQYYSFETNFTGDTINKEISLSLGASYAGTTSLEKQAIVSDGGAVTGPGSNVPITSDTQWSSVYDSNSNQVQNGDLFYFAGYASNGTAASLWPYEVDSTKTVQDLLDQLETTFGCNANIDANGRLQLEASSGGESALSITTFNTFCANGSTPFGSGNDLILNKAVVSPQGVIDINGDPVDDATTVLTAVYDQNNVAIVAGDVLTFSGVDVDGAVVVATPYTVVAGDTVNTLLTFIEGLFDGGAPAEIDAFLDQNGRIRVVNTKDPTVPLWNANLSVTFTTVPGQANPFGDPDINTVSFDEGNIIGSFINVTTSKQELISQGRAVNNSSGGPPMITGETLWGDVYDSNGDGVSAGDTIRFQGKRNDGTPINFLYPPVGGIDLTVSVQDLLDMLSTEFNCAATIDNAGQLVLTEYYPGSSQLNISSITYPVNTNSHEIFGPDGSSFILVNPDDGEDGSREGGIVSAGFEAEALTSSQYSNNSTTVFQLQDGFASGFLLSVAVDTQGIITGRYSNGQVLKKAQVALANFTNLQGLQKEGGNLFSETTNSGVPVTGAPGTNGLGTIASNSLEQSNVDIGTEFVRLISVQRGFQANARVITTTDNMMSELINIIR